MTLDSEELLTLVYSSDAIGNVGDGELAALLDQARKKNAVLGITGILLYRQGSFIQYLEGPADRVRRLYAEIGADSRHENLRVLLDLPAAARQFSDWTMGYERLRETSGVTPPGFRSTFDDLENTAHPQQALRAVSELAFWYHARAAQTHNRGTR